MIQETVDATNNIIITDLTTKPASKNKSITEIIIAISATLDGQTTAHYLAEILSKFNINITRLAHGLPVGGELDFLDDGTIAQALKARNKL